MSNNKKLYGAIAVSSALFAALLVVKSVVDFSHTGPAIRGEILSNYKLYSIYAIGRLGFWVFVLGMLSAGLGILGYYWYALIRNRPFGFFRSLLLGYLSLGAVASLLFIHYLFYLPGLIVASFQYRISRLYGLWDRLSPALVDGLQYGFVALVILFYGWVIVSLARKHIRPQPVPAALTVLSVAAVIYFVLPFEYEPAARKEVQQGGWEKYNILMIGSDSVRSDRMSLYGYERDTTPFLRAYAKKGVVFENVYVPLARTAPSLASFLTGLYPDAHGVRYNYLAAGDARLEWSLPKMLNEAGYKTVAIGDWAAADLGKFPFGFQSVDVAPDQWNIKYLIRQGPKDIRLFLSLFTHNGFGKHLLPELYYLAGVPMGKEIGRATRSKLTELARSQEPFFMMVFTSHAHIPFASEYPYYTKYSDRSYRGESRFAMAGLIDPEEIVKKQGMSKAAFDLRQVNDLYDGAIANFDAEVEKIVRHLEETGLAENTIVIIYSDHGVDLFERGTWGQGNTLEGRDPSLRIPLIVVDPRHRESAGKKVADIVRSIDLVPTLMELAGVEKDFGGDGESLMPYLRGEDPAVKRKAYAETGIWLTGSPKGVEGHLSYPSILHILTVEDKDRGELVISREYRDLVIKAKDRMIKDDKWKMIYFPLVEGAKYSLYDLSRDPDASRDVSQEYPEIYREYKKKLDDWVGRE